MRRSSRTLTGTLVILGVIAGACSPAATPAPSGAAPAPGATAPPSAAAPGTAAASPSAAAAAGGGELSMAVEGDLQTLDPAICYDTNCGPVMHMLFDSLVAYGPNSAELQAGLADLPDVSADGLTYTFHLRDGVSFTKQDGTPLRPVTADDVAYSINRILDPALKPYPSPVGPAFFAQIVGADKVLDGSAKMASGLKVVDPSTIEITIGAPNRAFLNVLAMSFGSIVPRSSPGRTPRSSPRRPSAPAPSTSSPTPRARRPC